MPASLRAAADEAGTRIGWVARIVQSGELAPADRESFKCQHTVLSPNDASMRYVVVGFARYRSLRYQTFAVPASMNIHPGDKVAVSVDDCGRNFSVIAG